MSSLFVEPDFCENVFCYNNGTCVSDEKTKKGECQCPEGFLGPKCGSKQFDATKFRVIFYRGYPYHFLAKNFCFKNKCENSAECVNGDYDYTCKCRQDFSGKFCQGTVIN